MLTKQRKHFNNARAIGGSSPQGGPANLFALSSGSGIFSDIISKVTSIASSSAAKQLGKSALEGATKGVKAGSEYAAKRGVEAIADKVSGARRSQSEQMTKKGRARRTDVQTITKELPKLSISKKQTIDASTRSMLDKLKRGSGKLATSGGGIKILN